MPRSSPTTSLPHPSQLLVEGNDDRNFIESLRKRLHPRHKIDVQNYDGRDRPRDYLYALVNHRSFEDVQVIGIIRPTYVRTKQALYHIIVHSVTQPIEGCLIAITRPSQRCAIFSNNSQLTAVISEINDFIHRGQTVFKPS